MINRILLNGLSQNAGVYIFKNKSKNPIYVGKAKHLKERLSYYFQENLVSGKTRNIVREAKDLEIIETASEVDALILEADFIKRLKPKYNTALKDDRNYLLVKIENPNSQMFPRVLTVRKKEGDSAYYFGPFPQGSSIKKVLFMLRKIYNFRDCRMAKFRRYKKSGRGCLYFDLGLCQAPCALVVSRKDYMSSLRSIKRFLHEGSTGLEKELEEAMTYYSQRLDFEKAAEIREKINIIRKIREIKFSPKDYRQNPYLAGDLRKEEIGSLIDFINKRGNYNLPHPGANFRIEAYDVSNLSGANPAASMVVFNNGVAQKNEYKKFRVTGISGINDYQMMASVLDRRVRHNDWPKPDLVLVDGGAGHVKTAQKVLENKFSVPVIGLAKRLERVYINGVYVSLNHHSPVMELLIRVRDESHRFAKKYHQLLRLRHALAS